MVGHPSSGQPVFCISITLELREYTDDEFNDINTRQHHQNLLVCQL